MDVLASPALHAASSSFFTSLAKACERNCYGELWGAFIIEVMDIIENWNREIGACRLLSSELTLQISERKADV